MFRNIFRRKERLVQSMEKVADDLVAFHSPELEEEQKKLWSVYNQVLSQEELLWYQKSRSKWLHSGDRNCRFFHGVTAVRHRRNSYVVLQDEDGNWIGEP